MKRVTAVLQLACAIGALAAIAASPARAADPTCAQPVQLAPPKDGRAAPMTRVQNYTPVLQQCTNEAQQSKLAIRTLSADGEKLLLAVDPATLAASLQRAACWTCAATDDEAQKDTRYLRALASSSQTAPNKAAQSKASQTKPDAAASAPVLRNTGLVHGAGNGSFVTGDLCPTPKPLERNFLESLEKTAPGAPVALSISGLWLAHHRADFQWLQDEAAKGALAITWVNHSYHHPYLPGAPLGSTFMLTPGLDPQAEILDTERLLIANGGTPSVFFRFPGLIADAALVALVRRDHLVTLGADSWLVFSPPLHPGGIVLVHPNGNEPAGLRLFAKLLDSGKLARPFRPIGEAPAP